VLRYEWLAAMEQSAARSPPRLGGLALHPLARPRADRRRPRLAQAALHGRVRLRLRLGQRRQSFGVEYYPKLLIGLPLSRSPRAASRGARREPPDVRAALLQAPSTSRRPTAARRARALLTRRRGLRPQGRGPLSPQHMQYHWKNPGYATYDDYLARFDSKRRNQLKRERGAAGTQGISLRTIRSAELEPAHAELAGASTRPPPPATPGAGAADPQLLPPRLRQHARRDRAGGGRAQGKIIAGAFNLHSPTRLFGRYWGCFEEHPSCTSTLPLPLGGRLHPRRPAGLRARRRRRAQDLPRLRAHAHPLQPPRLRSQAAERHSEGLRREEAEVARITAEAASISGLKPWPLPT